MKNKQKSFTVIELLVVIAIIGLLASITLVAIKGARRRAEIAGALQFSASIYHALGADIVGEWRFENNVDDTSGNRNNGQNNNVTFGDTDAAASQLGKYGVFNGASSYVEIPTSDSLKNPGKIITVEAWIKPQQQRLTYVLCISQYQTVAAAAIWLSNGTPTFWANGAAKEGAALEFGKWHHLVGTYDGNKDNANLRLFIDGKEHIPAEDGDSDLNIGGTYKMGSYCITSSVPTFSGNIDEVRIYKAELSAAQIQQRYAEGAKKRGLLAEE